MVSMRGCWCHLSLFSSLSLRLFVTSKITCKRYIKDWMTLTHKTKKKLVTLTEWHTEYNNTKTGSRCSQLHFINTWSTVSQPTFSPSPVFLLTVELGMWCDCLAGVTLNWGVLLAWSGLRGSLDWSVAPLYLACVLYTMFYDTIYSHQVLALPPVSYTHLTLPTRMVV